MATLLMGVINSVGQFVRATRSIFARHIPHEAAVYLDDVGVKGLKIKYNKKEIKLDIRKYVLKYL